MTHAQEPQQQEEQQWKSPRQAEPAASPGINIMAPPSTNGVHAANSPHMTAASSNNSSSSNSRPSTHFPDSPPHFPMEDLRPALAAHTIRVTDAVRILRAHEAERRRATTLLVRRYIHQLREGCSDPECMVRTCLGARLRRRGQGGDGPKRAQGQGQPPVRRLTSTAARAVAVFLVDSDDGEGGVAELCKAGSVGEGLEGRVKSLSRSSSGKKGVEKKKNAKHIALERDVESSEGGAKKEEQEKKQDGKKKGKRRIPPKDPKSFTQALFDTWPLRLLEWLPLPSPWTAVAEGEENPDQEKREGLNGQAEQTRERAEGLVSQAVFEDSAEDQDSTENTILKADADVPPVTPFSDGSTATWESVVLDSHATEESTHANRHHRRDLPPGKPATNGILEETPSHIRDEDRVNMDHDLPHTPHSLPNSAEVPPTQSLSHLSVGLVTELMKHLREKCDLCRGLKERQSMETPNERETRLHEEQYYHTLVSFARQSIFYSLADPATLLLSFRELQVLGGIDVLPMQAVYNSYRSLIQMGPTVTFHSLEYSCRALSNPPSPLNRFRSSTTRGLRRPGGEPWTDSSVRAGFITDREAIHLVLNALYALAAFMPNTTENVWTGVRKIRAKGQVVPQAIMEAAPKAVSDNAMSVVDALEDQRVDRLARCLVTALVTRKHFRDAFQLRDGDGDDSEPDLMEEVLKHLHTAPWQLRISPVMDGFNDTVEINLNSQTAPVGMGPAIIEILRTTITKHWDGKPVVARRSSVGAAVQLLESIFEKHRHLNLSPDLFQTPFLSDRMDPLAMPVEWLQSTPTEKNIHLLSYPFLFPPSALITYFRAINYSNMSKAYETAGTMIRLVLQMAFSEPPPLNESSRLYHRMKPAINQYLLLEVSRDNVLEDTLNQLWRREMRELLRPLKVRMGFEEGEEGVDHGGVQQEFFRLVMAEALNPDYGVFNTNPRTLMTWFQPLPLEPLWKFELIGTLVSLAIYNGVTLPVNFPLALYRKLLNKDVSTLEHINDGWEDLAKGLSDLLEWKDGDVRDVFVRSYEYSFEARGRIYNVDMRRVSKSEDWPGRRFNRETGDLEDHTGGIPDSWEGDSVLDDNLVTNNNRTEFVADLISWLTDCSIRAQYSAFACGFHHCLDATSLSMFTPEALRAVVEGQTTPIDINGLQRTTKYEDGYSPNHPLIRDFWAIVRAYKPARHRQLLEFVTASDRVPVGGVSSVTFVIQRNGPDSDRVPTSLTCFGRLLLPEYSSKEKLEEKLGLALENAKGFGVP